MNSGVLWASIVSGLVTFAVAGMSLIGASRAQRASARTALRQIHAEGERLKSQELVAVEAQAFRRAQGSYQRIVKDLEGQLDRNQRTMERVQDHLERVLTQLSQEKDNSEQLGSRVRELQRQMTNLQTENEQFRVSVDDHRRAAAGLRDDLSAIGLPSQPAESR